MSGRLTLALSEQIRSVTSWILTDSHHVVLRKKKSLDGNKYFMKETRENNCAEIKIGESDVIDGGALIALASKFQSNIIASSVHDSSVPSVLSEYDVPPFVEEVSEVHPKANEHSHSVASELSVPVTKTNFGASTSSTDHMQEETDELDGLKLELFEEGDINNLNLIFRDSSRKELHTINKASFEKLDNLEQLSSCATLQKNSSYSSLMSNSLAEGSNLTAHNVILPIGHDIRLLLYNCRTIWILFIYFYCLSDTEDWCFFFLPPEKLEEEKPLGYYSPIFLCQEKDSRKRKGLRKQDKNILRSDRTKRLPPSSDPKQKHDNNKHNPSWQLRVYNQLLREDR